MSDAQGRTWTQKSDTGPNGSGAGTAVFTAPVATYIALSPGSGSQQPGAVNVPTIGVTDPSATSTYHVEEDDWNVSTGTANGYTSNFYVLSQPFWGTTAKTTTSGNTAVISYPDGYFTFNPYDPGQPINQFTEITCNSWNVLMPKGGGFVGETAWDIWFGHPTDFATGGRKELMIWVNNSGQVPAGGRNNVGTVTLNGLTWGIWWRIGQDTTAGVKSTLSLVLSGSLSDTSCNYPDNSSVGPIDILGIWKWLATYTPPGWPPTAGTYTSSGKWLDMSQDGCWQFAFGAEICSTSGTDIEIEVLSYDMTING